MNKALICIKPPGIGDANILLSNVHHISKEINNPVTVLAQKTTGAKAIFKHDPHVNNIIDLGKKDFFVKRGWWGEGGCLKRFFGEGFLGGVGWRGCFWCFGVCLV